MLGAFKSQLGGKSAELVDLTQVRTSLGKTGELTFEFADGQNVGIKAMTKELLAAGVMKRPCFISLVFDQSCMSDTGAAQAFKQIAEFGSKEKIGFVLNRGKFEKPTTAPKRGIQGMPTTTADLPGGRASDASTASRVAAPRRGSVSS